MIVEVEVDLWRPIRGGYLELRHRHQSSSQISASSAKNENRSSTSAKSNSIGFEARRAISMKPTPAPLLPSSGSDFSVSLYISSVLTSSDPLRHVIDGLLSLASPDHTCRGFAPTFPQRSPPRLLTAAACGGLIPAPECRYRRTYPHLSYSCAPPFGPATLVTHAE